MKNKHSIFGIILASLLLTMTVWLTSPLDTKTTKLQGLVVHCSASPEYKNVTAAQIADYHMRPVAKKGRGWNRPGYNDVIELDGKVSNLVPYDSDTIVQVSEIANGAVGFNRIVRHVCYVGGMDRQYEKSKNTLTPAQDQSLKDYIFKFLDDFPDGVILGHNQLAAKACPSFDVPTKLREYGVPDKNIYKFKHRGNKIELLNSIDHNFIDVQSDFVYETFLPKSIPLCSENRFIFDKNYQRIDQRYGNTHRTRQCYNHSIARV